MHFIGFMQYAVLWYTDFKGGGVRIEIHFTWCALNIGTENRMCYDVQCMLTHALNFRFVFVKLIRTFALCVHLETHALKALYGSCKVHVATSCFSRRAPVLG